MERLIKLNIHLFDVETVVKLKTESDTKGVMELYQEVGKLQKIVDTVNSKKISFTPTVDLSKFTPQIDHVKETINGIFKGVDKEKVSNLFDTAVNGDTLVKSQRDMQAMQDAVHAIKQVQAKDLVANMSINVDKSQVENQLQQISQNETKYKVRLGIDVEDLQQKIDLATGKMQPDTSRLDELRDKLGSMYTEWKKNKDASQDFDESLKNVGNSSATTAANLTSQMGTALDKLKSKTSDLSSKFNTLLSSLGIQASFAGIVTSIKSAVMNTADYTEALNLFEMALGDSADEAKGWVKTISEALYLDDADIMKYTGSFYNLTKGLGATSKAAYLMSTNLTQLTFDMASYLNISNEMAYNKLMSAMSGQTKAVTSVGIAVQQASLQELARSKSVKQLSDDLSDASIQELGYGLGIKKSVSQMTQAEKTMLRYIQIMRSTKQMQGDLGRTIITPANAFRMLKTQLTLFARAVGEVLIPIIYTAMPPLIALTRLLQDLAKKLASMVGIEIPEVDYDKVKGLQKGIEKIGTGADKTGKKINRMLAPFDELNVVEGKQGSGSGGSDEDVMGILEDYLKGYDMLEDLNKEMAEQISEWEEKLKGVAKWLVVITGIFAGLKVLKFFGDIGGSITNIASALGLIKNTTVFGALSKGVTGLITAIKSFSIVKWLGELKNGLGAIQAFGTNPLNKFGDSLDFIAQKLGVFGKLLGAVGIITSFASACKHGEEQASGFAILLDILGGALSGVAFGPIGVVVGGIGAIAGALMGAKKASDKIPKQIYDEFDKQFGNLVKDMNKTTLKLKINPNMIIDDTTIDGMKNNTENLCNKIIEVVNNKKAEQEGILKTMLERGGISEDEYNTAMEGVEKYNGDLKTKTEDTQKQINEILDKYKGKNQKMTKEDNKKLQELQTQMNDLTIQADSEAAGKRMVISQKLNGELGTLSKEIASETIKDALKTRDETIKAADDQYAKELAAAQTMYKTGAINQETYDKMVANAKKTHDDTVDEANKQYDEIYNGFKENNEDIAKYIDKDTGNIKSGWTLFWEDVGTKFKNFWEGEDGNGGIKGKVKGWLEGIGRKIVEGLVSAWQNVKDWWNEHVAAIFTKDYWTKKFESIKDIHINTPHIKWDKGEESHGWIAETLKAIGLDTRLPKLKVEWYAGGGYPQAGEMFMMNERGPEFLTTIGNRTAVVNQDQMAKGVAEAVAQVASAITSSNGQPTTVIVNLGDEKLYEGQGSYQSRQTDRYGTTVVNI